MADGTDNKPERAGNKPESPGPETSGKTPRGGRGCLAGTSAALVLAWGAFRVAPWVHAHYHALVALAVGTAGLCAGAWLVFRSWAGDRAARAFSEKHGAHLEKLEEALARAEREVAAWERSIEALEGAADAAEQKNAPPAEAPANGGQHAGFE